MNSEYQTSPPSRPSCTHNAQIRFSSVHLCLLISVPTLFHASIPYKVFSIQTLFQTSVTCSRSKVFPFKLCSMHLFQTSVTCSCSRQSISFQICSMHLFWTTVPCSCSRQSISVPALSHASVPDFRSMQLLRTKVFRFQHCSMHLFQTSIPCSCSRQSFSYQLCSMHLF